MIVKGVVALVVAAAMAGAATSISAQTQAAAPWQAPAGWVTDPDASVLDAVPPELSLAGGDLRVVNMYRIQGAVLRSSVGEPPDTVVERLVRSLYAPYATFWAGYLGDETAFRSWAVKLLAPEHPLHERMPQLLAVGLDRRFEEGVRWIADVTGRRPRGTWYIVFGPGWTDMGGLGGIGMVADFTRMRPDSTAIANILPHELTHQVHGAATDAQPDAGTVLHRVISEGFASYVAWVYGAGARTPAQALGYSDAEWQWALEHEREMFDVAASIFDSRDRQYVDGVAERGTQLIAGAPGAGGYFIGFRIVQAYVAAHGADSWRDIYDLPFRDVLERSGYATSLREGGRR